MVSAETAASIELSSNAGSTSASVIGLGVAPSRFIVTASNCEAKMRTFLPLKSARCRIGALAMTEDGVDINSAAPCSPLSAPSPSISWRTAGSAARRWPCAIDVTRPGAASTSKRSSMPTKNSGATIWHWMAPNCTPSAWRWIEPNWLAG